MTVQELLNPRYMCTGTGEWHYPGSNKKPGDIIEYDGQSDIKYWSLMYDRFPHLYKPLPWYSERKPEDMPQYVKWTINEKRVKKITKWQQQLNEQFFTDIGFVDLRFVLPATEKEFVQQKNNNQ